MIRLNKGDEPQVLATNKQTWTQQLMDAIQNSNSVPSSLKTRYNHPEVKSSLRIECHDKCMYCESPISHITYEHIEHIKPKSKNKFPHLTFEWLNLGLACPKCNIYKGDYYEKEAPIINPYIEEPSNFLVAIGHFVYHKAGDSRGEITEKKLELNRLGLIERRKERIDLIRIIADKYMSEQNVELKDILKNELRAEISRDKPYSMCSTSIYLSLVAKGNSGE